MATKTRIPSGFGTAFFEWLRERTEGAWVAYQPQSVEEIVADFSQTGVMGCQWLPGTRWLGPLSKKSISRAEWRWGLHFPPNYRLFLHHLHTLDQPMLCPSWQEEIGAGEAQLPHLAVGPEQGFREGVVVLVEKPHFYNWLDDVTIQSAFAKLEQAVLAGDEASGDGNFPAAARWPAAWGPRPDTSIASRERIRELLAAAPRLIPIMSGHYLLAEPCRSGNPVFALPYPPWVPGFEVVAPDLRSFFLDRFCGLLGVDGVRIERHIVKAERERTTFYDAVPFWGPLLSRRTLP
jgi:hypothetical protein